MLAYLWKPAFIFYYVINHYWNLLVSFFCCLLFLSVVLRLLLESCEDNRNHLVTALHFRQFCERLWMDGWLPTGGSD